VCGAVSKETAAARFSTALQTKLLWALMDLQSTIEHVKQATEWYPPHFIASNSNILKICYIDATQTLESSYSLFVLSAN